MTNVKLLKSLKTARGIVKFMKVMTIIGAVVVLIAVVSTTLSEDFIVYALKNSSTAELDMLFDAADIAPEDIVPMVQAAVIPALVSTVICYLYLKKGETVLGKMIDESVFAPSYGSEIRQIGKLMVIEIIVTYVVSVITMFMFVPAQGSSVSLNIEGFFIVAFVYLASYLMDHAYEITKKDEYTEPQVIYSEPMIGDGSEM
ncbi:MAG: hypothetical protein IKM61_03855 [Eubacteriaceae bacterium]|nr:hypothetical protein [Eubacteriaceae bacterium]